MAQVVPGPDSAWVAEGSGGVGAGGAGGGGEPGAPGRWLTASAMLRGATVGGSPGMPGAGGGGSGGFTVQEEEVRSMLGLFAQLGKSRKDAEGRMDVPT